jgi:phosphocarrier protein
MTAKCQEIVAELEIKNNLGLHARPAAMFVQTAAAIISDIIVEREGECVNVKSLMG